MKYKVSGEGWGMTVTSSSDCQKLMLKGRDTEEIRSLIPPDWWIEAEEEIRNKEDQGKQKEKAFLILALLKLKVDGKRQRGILL